MSATPGGRKFLSFESSSARMKLRDKGGRTVLYRWRIDTKKYLKRWQISEMSGRPEMILQLAHHVADRLRRDGHPDVEIRAHTEITLNGRDPAPLIDPTVDLTRVERSIWPASWLLPLAQQLPESNDEVGALRSEPGLERSVAAPPPRHAAAIPWSASTPRAVERGTPLSDDSLPDYSNARSAGDLTIVGRVDTRYRPQPCGDESVLRRGALPALTPSPAGARVVPVAPDMG
jgi:hypothetical protein